VKVYELIQELAGYDAGDAVAISLPGGDSFDIEGVRRVGYGNNLVIDVMADESDLRELYGDAS